MLGNSGWAAKAAQLPDPAAPHSEGERGVQLPAARPGRIRPAGVLSTRVGEARLLGGAACAGDGAERGFAARDGREVPAGPSPAALGGGRARRQRDQVGANGGQRETAQPAGSNPVNRCASQIFPKRDPGLAPPGEATSPSWFPWLWL